MVCAIRPGNPNFSMLPIGLDFLINGRSRSGTVTGLSVGKIEPVGHDKSLGGAVVRIGPRYHAENCQR